MDARYIIISPKGVVEGIRKLSERISTAIIMRLGAIFNVGDSVEAIRRNTFFLLNGALAGYLLGECDGEKLRMTFSLKAVRDRPSAYILRANVSTEQGVCCEGDLGELAINKEILEFAYYLVAATSDRDAPLTIWGKIVAFVDRFSVMVAGDNLPLSERLEALASLLGVEGRASISGVLQIARILAEKIVDHSDLEGPQIELLGGMPGAQLRAQIPARKESEIATGSAKPLEVLEDSGRGGII